MKWPKSKEKIGIGVRGGGAREKLQGLPPAFLHFFLQNFTKKNFFHYCKMKWPKSEEKVENGGGGLEKLGGPPGGVPPPPLANIWLRHCRVWYGVVWCGVVWCGVVW